MGQGGEGGESWAGVTLSPSARFMLACVAVLMLLTVLTVLTVAALPPEQRP